MAYEASGCLGSGRVQTEIEISPGPLLRRTLLEHIKNSSDHFRFWHITSLTALALTSLDIAVWTSCPDLTATLTTRAFGRGSLQWLGIST
jgi:hypothetical protein